MKIYTRAGDDGGTALFGGARVAKDSTRVEAYGTVDELNSCLGAAVATMALPCAELVPVVTSLQVELFNLGAELATPVDRLETTLAGNLVRIGAVQVTALERLIDQFEAQLDPLKNFIVPGGHACAAALHVARTIARRAERRVVALAAEETVNAEVLRYLNRLSDLLFVLARTANRLEGVPDTLWNPRAAGGSN